MRNFSVLLLALSALASPGCGDDDGAGPADAGSRDTGPAPVDAGREEDGGPLDAGPTLADSGPADAGPDAGPTLDAGPVTDAGPMTADAGCVTDPAAACTWFDLAAPESMVDVHGAIRVALTASAPSIAAASFTLTVRDDAGMETTVTIEAAATGTALRGDAGPVVPAPATSWTRLEIAITDSCGTTPAPRAIYTFVGETGGRIDATCTSS